MRAVCSTLLFRTPWASHVVGLCIQWRTAINSSCAAAAAAVAAINARQIDVATCAAWTTNRALRALWSASTLCNDSISTCQPSAEVLPSSPPDLCLTFELKIGTSWLVSVAPVSGNVFTDYYLFFYASVNVSECKSQTKADIIDLAAASCDDVIPLHVTQYKRTHGVSAH